MSRCKVFSLICLLLCSLVSQAKQRTLEQARDIAYDFMRSGVMTKSQTLNLKMVYDGEKTKTRTSSTPSYYVFDNETGPGFVIVSGEDSVFPVLGFSHSYNFRTDNIPSNLRWWLRHVGRQIEYARNVGMSSLALTADAGTDLVKYETALWDQLEPYNAQCPMDGADRSATGCGPTAIAIAMRYREWPASGKGSIPDYEVDVYDGNYEYVIGTKSFPGRTLGQEYDWKNMPLTDGAASSWNTYQKEQVARLMADIGAAAKADYSFEGTGIYDEDVPPALKTYFGYDKSMEVVFREDWETGRAEYTASEWLSLVKAELANGPAVFAGSDDEGGHMFVLDGYTSNDYFSVNWGWGGYSNGYYKIDALEPADQGVGANMGSYNDWQSLMVNFRKNESYVAPEPDVDLKKTTSLKYVHETGLWTVKVADGVSVSWVSEKGTRLRVTEQEKNVYVLDCNGLEAGVYELELAKGTKTEVVSLVVGGRK